MGAVNWISPGRPPPVTDPRVTGGGVAADCVQVKVIASPSGSVADPDRTTVEALVTVTSSPALTCGTPAGLTLIVTSSLALAVPSLTVRVKTSEVVAVTVGAVNVAVAVEVLDRVTVVPDVWLHA